ncbi:MAG: hypothetical protein KDA45_12095 [Planctomycetales bacterium]|nr:hypothetical protein [Planctomycetales bacterium]
MTSPRWFFIALSLLVLNAGLVVSSVVWRHAGAGEPPAQAETPTGAPSGEVTASETTSGGATPGVTIPAETEAIAGGQRPVPPDAGESTAADAGESTPPAATAWDAAARSRQPRLLDSLPIPGELPSVPSLSDSEAVQRDPVFQEFRKLFAEETPPPALSSAPSVKSAGAAGGEQSQAYFAALDQRLEAVEQLCAAARNISAEASRWSRAGDVERSRELLQMATQLRDMSAKLLVQEL